MKRGTRMSAVERRLRAKDPAQLTEDEADVLTAEQVKREDEFIPLSQALEERRGKARPSNRQAGRQGRGR